MKSPISLHDIQGIAFGILMTSLGVVFLKACGLVTGQTAGVAVLLSYVTSLSFGMVFFLISLPFFVLGWFRRGAEFTLKTFVVVVGISFLSDYLSQIIVFERLPALLGAIIAGACSGIGLVALFRHKASAGGLGILALIVEEKTGFKTGWFQLCFDGLVFIAACFVLTPEQVFYSFIGAVTVNLIIGWNFRLDQVGKL